MIVDFTERAGRATTSLRNVGPDEPFGGGVPGVDFDVADPGHHRAGHAVPGRPRAGARHDHAAQFLQLPADPRRCPAATGTRPLALVEEMSWYFDDAPAEALLGTSFDARERRRDADACGPTRSRRTRRVGTTEVWEIYNFTADAHPMHIHEVLFEVVNRQAPGVDEDEIGHQAVPAPATRRHPSRGRPGSRTR